MNTRKSILIRTTIVFSGMLVFAGAVAYSLFTVQFVEGAKWRRMADSLSTHVFSIEAVRGNIFDSKGNLLATSLPIYDVRLDAKSPAFKDEELFQNNIDSLAICLANLFGDKSVLAYKQSIIKIRKEGNRYLLFKRKISYKQMRALYQMPLFRMGKYKGGLLVQERTRREKPFGMLAERTIGFKQEEGAVRVGLEGYFDKHLSGMSGKRVMQRIAGGAYIPIDDELMIDAQQGRDIVTTLDINLQDVSEQALLNNLIENDADYGTAILMEVATGEIKALANLTRVSEGVYQEKYNYAVGESVEPGSTFKLVSTMALLEDGYMKPDSKIDAEGGQIRFCNLTMKDSHLGTGVITLQEAFEHSSNVAFAKMMQSNYAKNPSQVFKHYKDLGLTEKLNLQLSGVGAPVVKGPANKSWSCTSLPYMAIGYELQITPLQLLSVYNAIANNGVMVRPLLVKRIEQSGKIIKEFPMVVSNSAVCKPAVAKQLRNMMEGVVLHGTASSLKSNFYSYAGKTGTAVVANNRRGYQAGGGKSYRASFAGYFPAENPKYSCFVLISRPRKENYYAAKVALPVFKEIADKVYASALNLHRELKFTAPYISDDLPKIAMADKQEVKTLLDQVKLSSHFHNDSINEAETDWVITAVQDHSIALEPTLVVAGKMPNLIGMGAKDALYLLERKGIKVELKGLGKVKKQSLSPGASFKKNQLIQLQLG
ncbi:MAG: penicillin-binding transpeptidase domain-containing protein [bacterium]|nr:penicillin-binding transpeptidase domain-containing protein [bacterium]